MNGQRFVRPDFQLLVALYGIHFAVWVPIATQLPTPKSTHLFLFIISPLIVCGLVAAILRKVSYAVREFYSMSDGDLGFLLYFHLCLLFFTLLCIVMSIVDIDFIVATESRFEKGLNEMFNKRVSV